MGNLQYKQSESERRRYVAVGDQSYHRGPHHAIAMDGTVYKPIINEYLHSIHIFETYDRYRVLTPLPYMYNEYRHIYKREHILQFIWPQCVGIPMLYFDLDTHDSLDWWIDMYRPYFDAMLEYECTNDRHGGVFVLLGWIMEDVEHQTVLHFDIHNKMHTFFDPMQRHNEQMKHKSLATGYKPNIQYHAHSDQPIQEILERHYHLSSPPDSCSAICFLLLVCCRRFGTADLHGMSAIIKDLIVQRDKDISTIRYNMWLFYIELGVPGMQLFSRVGLCGVAASNPNCTVMVKRDGSAYGVPIERPFTDSL